MSFISLPHAHQAQLEQFTGVRYATLLSLSKAVRAQLLKGRGRPFKHSVLVMLALARVELRLNLSVRALEALTGIDSVTVSRCVLRVTAALGELPLARARGWLVVDSTSVRANGAGATSASLSGPAFVGISQFSGYRAWSDGSLATTCNTYRTATGSPRYAGVTGDGMYRIDTDGAGPRPAVNVWCNMSATPGVGYTELSQSSGTPLHASGAEAQCNTFGLQLFVPRTSSHFSAARSRAGTASFVIMGIYPKVKGATCIGTGFNSSTCSAWGPKNGSAWFVQSGINASEPNGDNDTDGSMGYQYDAAGNVVWYNDIENVGGGHRANQFVCSAPSEG